MNTPELSVKEMMECIRLTGRDTGTWPVHNLQINYFAVE